MPGVWGGAVKERIQPGRRGWAIFDSRRRAQAAVQLPLAEEVAPYQRDGWTTDDWATPWPLVHRLEEEFGPFELDPCATSISAKAPRFYAREDDGLRQPWAPARTFLNPPYSTVATWIRKAIDEAAAGALVVCLIPSRTDQDWFHDLVLQKAEVRFLRGRQRFIGADGTTVGRPVFASALAVYRRGRWLAEGRS